MNNTTTAADPLQTVFSDDQSVQSILEALSLGRFEHAVQQTQDLYARQGLGAGGMPLRLSTTWEDCELTPALLLQTGGSSLRTERGHCRFIRGLIKTLRRESAAEDLRHAFNDLAIVASYISDDALIRVRLANLILFIARYVPELSSETCASLRTARTELKDALHIDPKCAPAHHSRGLLRLFAAGSIKNSPGDPQSYYHKAIDSFTQASRLDPSYAWSHQNLGLAKKALCGWRSSQGGSDPRLLIQAVSHFEEAARIDPTLQRALYKAAQTYLLLDRKDEARLCLARCREFKTTRRSHLGKLEGELWKSVTTGVTASSS